MTLNIWLSGRSGRWIVALAAVAGMVSCAQIVGLTGDYHEGPQGDAGASGSAQGGDDTPVGHAGKSSAGGAHTGGGNSESDAGGAGENSEGGAANPGGGTGGDATPSAGASAGGKPAANGGTGGTTPSGGAAGSGTAGAGAAGAPPVNYGGVLGLEDLSKVKASSGCGNDVTAAYPGIAMGVWQPTDAHNYMSGFTIPVATPANHPVAAIAGMTLQRRYFIRLPTGFDNSKPYRLLYEGASCTGKGTDVADFSGVTNGSAIIVAIEIYPGVWGSGTGPDGGSSTSGISCFDERRGPLSIEFPFIEALHARLKSQFCIDEHRVFFAGHSSGSWIGNQFGSSYGSKIFRAIAMSSGGIPPVGQQGTSDGLPVPGIWWHQLNDATNPFQATKDAVSHALVVNKCTTTDYDTSPTSPDAAVPVCKRFTSCPAQFPITVCNPPGTDHSDNLSNAAYRTATWAFLSAF